MVTYCGLGKVVLNVNSLCLIVIRWVRTKTEPIHTKHTAVDVWWCGVPDDYLII